MPSREKGLVSVIVPMYNAADYVVEALDSIFSQECPDLEVLVVDDGSTDDSAEVVRERYGESVQLLQKPNGGVASARNLGLERARGEYIALLDADDLWLKGRLKAHLSFLRENPEFGLVFSDWAVWMQREDGTYPSIESMLENGLVPASRNDNAGWLYPELLMECVLQTSGVTMRRELVERVGRFDEFLKRGEDYDYWLRVSRISPMGKVPVVLSLYRMPYVYDGHRLIDINFEDMVVRRAYEKWGLRSPDGKKASWFRFRRRRAITWTTFSYEAALRGNLRESFAASAKALSLCPWCRQPWIRLAKHFVQAGFGRGGAASMG